MGRSNKLVSSVVAILVAAVAAYGGIQLSDGSGSDTGDSSTSQTTTSQSTASTAQATATDTSGAQAPAPASGQADLTKISGPEQAAAVADVLQAIDSGDPLPYDQDGSVFQNREGNLPDLPSGEAYHEYTVPTPGSPDRGARRLVISTEGAIYYTDDHYETFTLLND